MTLTECFQNILLYKQFLGHLNEILKLKVIYRVYFSIKIIALDCD